MKPSNVFTLCVGSALLLSSAAFAGNTNRKSLHLTDTVTVEGQQLKPGQYTVEWDGSGPEVQVNIVRGNKTVATASAHIVAAQTPNKEDAYTTLAQKDGSRSLTQFSFQGERFDLDLSQSANASASPGKATSGTN